MHDILSDLEQGLLSDPDPVRRAQIQMRSPKPKRFYEAVSIGRTETGWSVLLDGKPVRTPGKTVLELPSEEAAALVAAEFDAQLDEIDIVSMPVTRLANTVVDGVASDPQAVAEDILRFVSSDLVFYRADAPAALVERQSDAWDPVLDWVRGAVGARFILAEGVMHVTQPRESIGAVGIHLARRSDPFRLGALHVMTTLMGSALLALAVEAQAIDPDTAWAAAHVDEDWNVHQWGADAEAVARRDARRRDLDAAVALLRALPPVA